MTPPVDASAISCWDCCAPAGIRPGRQPGSAEQPRHRDRCPARFLKVDEAFVLESEQQGDRLTLTLRIADDYYLYRHSIRVKGENLAFDDPSCPRAPSTRTTSSARAGSSTRRWTIPPSPGQEAGQGPASP